MKIAIIGSSSMIAAQTCDYFQSQNVELTNGDLTSNNPIDITDKYSVSNFFQNNQFDWAILFSAYTDVNGAEKQRDDQDGPCWKINVEGLKNIADEIKKTKRKLVFISTDFVFDGTKGNYKEEDPTGPNLEKVGWYGITKIKGEEYIKNTLPEEDYIILRISSPYGPKKHQKEDFLKKIVAVYKTGNIYPLYDDQIFTPTFIPDVGKAIHALIKNNKTGIYHLASPKPITPYEIASYLISKLQGKEVQIPKGKLEDAQKDPGAVPRPLKSNLIVEKITPLFTPTSWSKGADKMVAII